MTLPTVTLTAHFTDPDASPTEGTVVIRLTTPMLDVSGNVIVPAQTLRVPLDRQGRFSLDIVPSDAAGLAPNPVPYQVTEQFGSNRRYLVAIPSDSSTVDLSDLAPVGEPPTPPSVYALKADLDAAVAAAEGEAAAAQAAAIGHADTGDALLIPLAQKGAANGVPSLDGTGAIPDTQIPATIARDAEVTSSVAAAVAALVNSAPSTRDTLGEIAALLSTDESAAAALATTVAGKMNVVVHGSTAGTARPTGALITVWVGSATPASAVTDDLWVDKSVTPAVLRRYNGSAFDVLGGGGAGASLTLTAVKTAAYTAAAGEAVPVDTTSSAVPITLPTAPPDKTQVLVKHVVQGGSNAVSVNSAGSDVFNRAGGPTSVSLPLLAQAVWLQYRATGAIWYVLSDDLPLSQLDARYVTIANAAPLDTVAADIQPTTTGSASAGSTSKSADAGHVHKIGAHASTHATGGADVLTPAAIGAVATTSVGANNGVAQLDSGGKIPTSQLPAITMNTVWPSVASQAAMLALAAEPGDVAVRTDVNANFMLAALPASTLANWVQLAAPAGGVTSVFGRTGAVTLLKSDVTATGLAAADVGADASGAASTVQTNLTSEISRAQTAELARLLPRGAWAATTAYAVNDAVIAGGLSWRCITAHTSGSTFSGDLTKWEPQGLLYEAIDAVAIASGTTTHTMSPVYLSTMKRYTLANTASCAFTLPAATAGASFSAIFEQDATGNRAFTIVPAGTDTAKWIPNVTPTFSVAASAADEVAGRCYVAGQWRLTANIGG